MWTKTGHKIVWSPPPAKGHAVTIDGRRGRARAGVPLAAAQVDALVEALLKASSGPAAGPGGGGGGGGCPSEPVLAQVAETLVARSRAHRPRQGGRRTSREWGWSEKETQDVMTERKRNRNCP